MGVKIEVIAHRDLGETEVKVTEGLFTFVALDANNRPRPVDADQPGLSGRRDFVVALGGTRRASAAARTAAALPRLARRLVVAADRRRQRRRTGWSRRSRRCSAPARRARRDHRASSRRGRSLAVEALAALLPLPRARAERSALSRRLASASTSSSSPSSSSKSSSRWRRGFCSSKRERLSLEHAEIMVGDIGDNIRSGRGRPRAAHRAPCSCIFRAAGRHCRAGGCPGGCPAVRRGSGPRCPPRPRRRPPCRLLIKCLLPYAVVASPFGLGRAGRRIVALLLTLSFRSAHQARNERPIASGVGTGCALSFRGGAGPALTTDVVRHGPDAKRFRSNPG